MIKLDILAIGVHPDDIELSCAGTILKEIAEFQQMNYLEMIENAVSFLIVIGSIIGNMDFNIATT